MLNSFKQNDGLKCISYTLFHMCVCLVKTDQWLVSSEGQYRNDDGATNRKSTGVHFWVRQNTHLDSSGWLFRLLQVRRNFPAPLRSWNSAALALLPAASNETRTVSQQHRYLLGMGQVLFFSFLLWARSAIWNGYSAAKGKWTTDLCKWMTVRKRCHSYTNWKPLSSEITSLVGIGGVKSSI